MTGACRGSNAISWFSLRRMDVCLGVGAVSPARLKVDNAASCPRPEIGFERRVVWV